VATAKLLFRRHQTTDQTFTRSTNYETVNKVAIVRSCEKAWCTLITITIIMVNDHMQKFNFHVSVKLPSKTSYRRKDKGGDGSGKRTRKKT